jgi:hypothetical protein
MLVKDLSMLLSEVFDHAWFISGDIIVKLALNTSSLMD